MKNLKRGIEILESHYTNNGVCKIGASHDQINAYPTDIPLSIQEVLDMIAAKWHQEYEGRDYNSDFVVSDYKEYEGWIYYT